MRNLLVGMLLLLAACSKSEKGPEPTPTPPSALNLAAGSADGRTLSSAPSGVRLSPMLTLTFNNKVDRSTVGTTVTLSANGANVSLQPFYENADSTLVLQPSAPLSPLTRFQLTVGAGLKSAAGGSLAAPQTFSFVTGIDSSDKFQIIGDSALVDLVQRQTFRYFWDFGHPVSGLARERNTSGNLVTSGGSGFGVMAILVGIQRGFISKAQGLTRLQTMVSFLKNTAQKFKGAFPHWLDGATGAVIPFSAKDNGADLVETSFLIQGLLCARQYFGGADAAEMALRADINQIWQGVEWSWFRKNNENVLYWHWSNNFGWDINLPIRGWNESLITYVLAASSPTYGIPKAVYDNGWASNGGMRNGNSYYGIMLPLGPPLGGPLFFEHYSFLGINPFGLSDAYANYQTQAVNHTRINYEYSKANPKAWYGYSDASWGLTASDIPGGYTASSPTNDIGVIAPTAALSSFPYTPAESMKALKFFYYKLGDRLWGEYGFKDAFNLHNPWFADSYLAIDQGPIIVMIENYRSGLLWNLFSSIPEIKNGMKGLGFSAPYL